MIICGYIKRTDTQKNKDTGEYSYLRLYGLVQNHIRLLGSDIATIACVPYKGSN